MQISSWPATCLMTLRISSSVCSLILKRGLQSSAFLGQKVGFWMQVAETATSFCEP